MLTQHILQSPSKLNRLTERYLHSDSARAFLRKIKHHTTMASLQLKKVLISDAVDPKCVTILQENGIEAVLNTKLSKDELLAEIPKYDGLIVRSATKVTADVIAAAKNLKIIGRAGTGVDNIDVTAATQRGIIVMKQLAHASRSMVEGRWDRKQYMGHEVMGKTLAIVGLGRIGKEVAIRMQSFGMTTIGFDPIIPGSVSAEFGVEWLPLEEMWPRADYITVHTPLIPQTKNLVSLAVLRKCKPGVRVVNCARGGIIDEDELLVALNEGTCGGAGLDVFMEEPPTNMALVSHPRTTCTPHLGASTVEAQSRVAMEIAEQFVDMMKGKSLFGAINAHALSNALSPDTKPWVSLATALGGLAAALLPTPITAEASVTVTTQGPSLKSAGSYTSAAALVGLLRTDTQNGLNLVSAPALAKDKGLKVATEHSEGTDSVQSVCVRVSLGSAAVCVQGSAGSAGPQLMSVDGAAFSPPASLGGATVVWKGKDSNKQLANIIGDLTAAGVQLNSVALSSDGSCGVAGVDHPLTDTEPLKQRGLDLVKVLAL